MLVHTHIFDRPVSIYYGEKSMVKGKGKGKALQLQALRVPGG